MNFTKPGCRASGLSVSLFIFIRKVLSLLLHWRQDCRARIMPFQVAWPSVKICYTFIRCHLRAYPNPLPQKRFYFNSTLPTLRNDWIGCPRWASPSRPSVWGRGSTLFTVMVRVLNGLCSLWLGGSCTAEL